jgi:tetratricopeptide (TPR) repeat protein
MSASRGLDIAVELDSLADDYYQDLRLEEAESIYWLVLVIREKALGREHPDVAISLRNLAALYETMGRWNHAERFHKRAIKISEAQYGNDHPSVMVNLHGLAENYISQHKYEDALDLMERQLDFWRTVLGQAHPFIASRREKYDQLINVMNTPLPDNVLPFPLKSQALADCTDHG